MVAATKTSAKKEERLLKGLAEHGNVLRACEEAGIRRDTAYKRKRSDPEFASRWEDALRECCETMMAASVDERAFEGTPVRIIKKDGTIIEKTERSDVLAMFRMKKLDPTYRDNAPQQPINVDVKLALDV